MNNIIRKETLMPISFVLLLIGGIIYGERRINKTEHSISKLEIIVNNQAYKIDKLETAYIPAGELNIWMKQIEQSLQEVSKKIKYRSMGKAKKR